MQMLLFSATKAEHSQETMATQRNEAGGKTIQAAMGGSFLQLRRKKKSNTREGAAYKSRPALFLVTIIPINNTDRFRSRGNGDGDCCIRAALRAGKLGGATAGMASAGVGLAEPAEAGPGAAGRGPPRHVVPLPGRRRQGGGASPGGGAGQADAFALARDQRSRGPARPQRHPRTRYAS
jgi:hypothetical protein